MGNFIFKICYESKKRVIALVEIFTYQTRLKAFFETFIKCKKL